MRLTGMCLFDRGVMQPPIEQLTTEGYDMQFGTNVLGEFSSLSLPTTTRSFIDSRCRPFLLYAPSPANPHRHLKPRISDSYREHVIVRTRAREDARVREFQRWRSKEADESGATVLPEQARALIILLH